MTPNELVREAAANGAVRLDEDGPSGWYNRVDMNILNIDEPDVCLLGQVYAGNSHFGHSAFLFGLSRLGLLGLTKTSQYGFAIKPELRELGEDTVEAMYYDAWNEQIVLRQTADSLAQEEQDVLVTA